MSAQPGVWIHHTYADVLAALAVVEPASATAVLLELEGSRGVSGHAKKRRQWVWHALLNLTNAGRVECVIENGHYVWQTKRREVQR